MSYICILPQLTPGSGNSERRHDVDNQITPHTGKIRSILKLSDLEQIHPCSFVIEYWIINFIQLILNNFHVFHRYLEHVIL